MKVAVFILFMLMIINPANAGIRLPKLVSDNMVLQQKTSCAIWGWAEPGEKITVTFRDKKMQTVTARDSSWIVHILSGAAGGPFELKISGKNEVNLQNIMVGEVWICSGQSNMEMPLAGWGKITNYKQEIEAADYPSIRLFTVPKSTCSQPLNDVAGSGWSVCSRTTIPEFSALAYFFGRDLHQKLGVPIGLINTSWGGTIIESWISRESISKISDFQPFVAEMDNMNWDVQKTEFAHLQKLTAWEQPILAKDQGFQDGRPLWSDPAYNDRDWLNMSVPQLWDSSALGRFEGSVWYRINFNLAEVTRIQKAVLHLGPIDEWDITWLNGREVGRMTIWDKPRVYALDPEFLNQGANSLVIHVMNFYGEGGLWQSKPDDIRLELTTPDGVMSIPLAGSWKYRPGMTLPEKSSLPPAPAMQDTPTFLFNAMIHPLVKMNIRGAIWYQGESNTGRAWQYRTLLPLMIKDWRKAWHTPDFPFLIVQLANYNPVVREPGESSWAELREAQSLALKLKNTGLAVAIDIGEANDIHPKNKQEVGRRLALAARKIAYGEKIVYSGPVYERMKVESDKIRMQFKQMGSGLIVKDDEVLQGFTIAAADRKFVQAEARIEGNSVVVWHDTIKKPVAVRYAWADNPQGCNLYNKEGLPASPFRTDNWPGITGFVKH
jgi:sialate O-acetylesterase